MYLHDSQGIPSDAYTAGYRSIDNTPPITTPALMYPSGAPPVRYATDDRSTMSDGISFDLSSLILPTIAFFAGWMVAKHY